MRRFPVGLTIAAGFAFLILVGLGGWQLQRLRWKEDLLAHIAALQHAPAQPIAAVLARAAAGADVDFTRVRAFCLAPAAPPPAAFRYALRAGAVGWRLLTMCRLSDGSFDGVLLDRGLVLRDAGHMSPAAARFADPGSVTGILRALGSRPLLGGETMSGANAPAAFRVVDAAALTRIAGASRIARPAPYMLAVEAESPPLTGVLPAPLPQDVPNNHLGYALTWFGLAIALVWIWAARVFGRGD